MKLLALDIDGVLNSHVFLQAQIAAGAKNTDDLIDPSAVRRLNTIIERTQAKIVISSSWRIPYDLDFIASVLAAHGFRYSDQIIGKTPNFVPGLHGRGNEIQEFMWEHRVESETLCILDDDSDMLHLAHRLVRTSYGLGLQDEHVELCVAMLNESSRA